MSDMKISVASYSFHGLLGEGKIDIFGYLNMLKSNFNPHAAAHIMCRNLLSIGWDGYIYDCDFNQALGLPLKETPHKIGDLSKFDEIICDISFSNHCFACTAGAGSSCNGAMV